MKHTYFLKFLMVFFTLTGVFAYGQFTVTFGSIVYVNGQPVAQGSPISIGTNNSVSVKFDVDITTNNPPSSSQPGEITLWYKKNASAFPVSIITQGGVVFNGNQTTRPMVVDLYGSNFDPTGGVVYAEFKSFSGLIYKSGNWSVTKQNVPDITNNVIVGNQSIFYGQVAAAIGGSTPGGGTGTFTFLWDKKTATSEWVRLTVTSQSLAPGVLLETTQYRRHVISATKGNVSNTVTVTVNNSAPITNNAISANQTINEGNPAIALSGTLPSGGNGAATYRYEWQKQEGTGTWTAIAGATEVNYAPGSPFVTAKYRRVVRSGNATDAISNEVTITVIPAPTLLNNSISISGNIISGSLPIGGTGIYTYTWILLGGDDPYIFPENTQNLTLSESVFEYLNSYPNLSIVRNITSGRQTISSNFIVVSAYAAIQNNTISKNGTQIIGSLPTGGSGIYAYSWILLGADDPYNFPDTGQSLSLTPATIAYMNGYPGSTIIRTVRSGGKTSQSNALVYATAGRPAAKAAIATEASKGAGISVYPNPVAEVVHFALGNEIQKNMVISVYSDFSGQELPVYSGNVAPGQIVTWNVPAQCARGLYFYKIVCGNDVTTGKLLLR